MTKILRRAAVVLAGWAAAPTAQAEDSYDGLEIPPYRVEQAVGDAEIRLYAPHILAEVTVRGGQSGALNQGFRVLAGYIFGGNTNGDKVAMTAPVTQAASEQIAMTAPVSQSGADGLWTVTFMMPRAYSLETLPTPNSEAVRFVQADEERRLVLQFSGRAPAATMNAQADALRKIAADAGIAISGPPQFSFYDDPMTLPWNRRNEVSFALGS